MNALRYREPVIRLVGKALAVALFVAGCTSIVPPTPAGSSRPTASAGDTGSGGACQVVAQGGLLRSNTLTGTALDSDGVSDRITFTFGPTAPGPTGSSGRLTVVTPPFTQAGSGLPVTVLGSRFVELHLDGMLMVDDAGNQVYQGETSLRPDMIAIKSIEETDGFEGVYNFVIGYDGSGCVGLSDDAAAGSLTITIGH